MQEEKLREVDVIRAAAVVIVVFFHAYGMMYAPAHFPNTVDVYREKYYWFNSICLWFHMPLFIFLSGGVYGYLYETKGKYSDFFPFLRAKFKRLFVPYFLFASLFMLTTNSWSWEALFRGTGFTHLWFLPMLFYCFFLGAVLYRLEIFQYATAKLMMLVASFWCMVWLRVDWNIMGIASLFRWFFWFYLGMIVYSHRALVYGWIKKTVIVPYILPLFYIISMWYMVGRVGCYTRSLISECGFAAIVIWIWYVVCWIIERWGNSWCKSKVIVELSSCSFGIYIFHYWIEPFMISRTVQKILPLADWAAGHTVLFPLVFSLLALLISYVMTKMLLLTRIGRSLIG